ncbi:MAG TPA: sigma-70 family RNA polymerase sigma factor [Candidatus Binatia bacterium]|nr:sigma-70 family RNA polymerase sigma factor [Candidatus Binatia bacterium]
MASASSPQAGPQLSAAAQAFASEHYAESGAARFGMDLAGLANVLVEVLSQRDSPGRQAREILESLHLEELVLSRACLAGHNGAWELFLTRYRGAMYEAAWRMARDEGSAKALADSLYAELYGLGQRGESRASKLRYYTGRGSLAGWLRTVVAQEYVNQYRRTKRETSLDAAVEDGKQFAAADPQMPEVDPRVEAATASELAALPAEERLLLAAYYLDGRTLAEIARLLGVHESTVSRKLEHAAGGLRKRIRKRLMEAGMPPRQADEAMQDVDVRDLKVKVSETLRQARGELSFYKEKEG